MDQGMLVDERIDDGKRLIERLTEEGVVVDAACWIRETESGRWYLYIVTPLVGTDGAKRPAYRRVNETIQQMPRPFRLDFFEVKVVSPTSPVGEAIIGLHRRYSGKGPIRYGDYRLGDMSVEEIYLYPPRWIFVFEYGQRGDTTQWDAISPGHCVRAAPDERWQDGEVRVEAQGRKVVIKVRCDEAVEENDAAIAEELANAVFQKRFPGHTVVYHPEGATP
jgi:hypothetical protein